ncbi:two-component system, sensor histidine kinase ChiS [Thermoflexales bacterium]|nr:two-component system, sensor histidine kinase ChiS [Thermoflexales bacterium]
MPIATLLVVEDDPLQMDMLEMILTRNNMTLLRASTGEVALQLYQQHTEIDLILLDVMLPGQLDGLAVCRRVRADQQRLYVPIIMVTALGKTEQLVQGLDAGADDYLTKPFSSRELMARLQAGLRIRRTQRDLAEAQSRYRLLVETARDLLFALDTHDQLTYISPMSETLTGYPPEALLADPMPFACFVHPDDARRLNEWHAHLRDQPEGSDLEFRIRRADSELRWGTLAWTTIYNREGHPAGVQGTIRDITHRKAVEAATWRRSQELAALNLIAARLNQSLQLSNTLAEALHALLEVMDVEYGAVHAVHERQAFLRTAHGLSETEVQRLPGPSAVARWYSSDLEILREAVDATDGQIDLLLKALGIQVIVTVPLHERGELTGLLTLASRAIDKFEATEITLISTVAEQISAAMTNARLYEEAQHRAEELSILYDIGRMLTSTLDLTKVLRVIMEAAVGMLQAEAGSVLLLDEANHQLEFVAAVGARADLVMNLRLPAGAGVAGQALREGRSLLVDDAQHSASFYEDVDHTTGLTTQRLIATPLRVKERFIGVMEVINKRHGPFTAADMRVLDMLAPTAAAAIDNARLYARETQLTEEVRRHNRELSALHAISAALSQSLEIQDVLDVALMVLQPQFDYGGGCIYLNGDGTTPAVWAHHEPSDGIPLGAGNLAASDFVARAISARAVHVLPDTSQLDQKTAAVWAEMQIGAFAAVPLWGHDVVQGGLAMAWREPRPIDHANVQLLAAIGQQIGVAVERASLYEVAQRRAHEIERSYAQLVQSEKLAATGRLAMSLAHEINNPLQAIQNCLHLVLEFSLPEDRQADYLKMAREEVERLSILVQSMLDFYRPARGGQLTANIRAVLDRVLALADQKLRYNQIETILHYPDEPLIVQSPADQLGQVCLNLIMNAAEAMENGGTLQIDAKPRDGMIELLFHDTGEGIPPEVLAHIFEPFYTTKEEGTGLGLAISYTIIERQGGSLQVESEVGRGTLFTIRLPRAEPAVDESLDAAQI